MNVARLVDTHTHLGDPVFDADRAEVLGRARDSGVGAVIVVTEALDEVERNLALARIHPELRLAFGLYPTHLDEEAAATFEEIIRRQREDLVAIGEVGLDRWMVKDERDRELQCRIFRRFIRLANELELPLNVHSRSAGHQAIDVLIDEGARKVQLHAFDGRASRTRPAIEAGFFFSIPPSVVRSQQKQKLLSALPLECLLLETDSPVLGPVADERNEPANVRKSLDAIAEVKELEVERVEQAVIANTKQLYGDLIG